MLALPISGETAPEDLLYTRSCHILIRFLIIYREKAYEGERLSGACKHRLSESLLCKGLVGSDTGGTKYPPLRT